MKELLLLHFTLPMRSAIGIFAIASIYLLPFTSLAGGFQVNLQGQKQTGMGHVGTGLVLGASSAFFNPGGFAFVDSNHISLGASFIISDMQYLEPYPGTYTTQTIPKIGTPFTIYSAFRIDKLPKLNFGLAVYTPFGSSIQYEDEWKGQFVLREMALRTIYIQPTIGWQVNERIGVGIGYIYGIGSFSLRKGIPAADQQGEYGEGLLTGNTNAHGLNVGIHCKLTEQLSFGLNFRPGTKVKEDKGLAEFTVPAALEEYFPSTTFSTSITLPSVVSLGWGYQWNEKTLLGLDVNFVMWSAYDTLSFDFHTNTEKLEDIHSPREYNDSYIVRLGGQHILNEKLVLRAGAYYDITPVQDGYITPETPDANKFGLTLGASYSVAKNFNVDVSFLYVEGAKRTDINLETEFGGTWKARAYIPGIALQYNF